MSARDRKRSTRYVNSLLQGHMMWRMAMYWVIYNAALIAVIVGEKLLRLVPELIAGKSTFSVSQFASQFVQDSRVLMMAMAVFCPVLIWDMLKFSHRIAGPIYRFRRALEDHVSGGPLKAVSLRDGDLMGDFQGTFNEFVAYVHSQNTDSARRDEATTAVE